MVEFAVERREFGRGLEGVFLLLERLVELLEVQRRPEAGSGAGHLDLEEQPGLLKVIEASLRMEENLVDRVAEPGHRAGERRHRHAGALAVPNLHQPHALQVLHRFAHRRATDLIERHQLALGWQEVAGEAPAGLDLL